MKKVLFVLISVITLSSCRDESLENLEKKNQNNEFKVSNVDRGKIIRPGEQTGN